MRILISYDNYLIKILQIAPFKKQAKAIQRILQVIKEGKAPGATKKSQTVEGSSLLE